MLHMSCKHSAFISPNLLQLHLSCPALQQAFESHARAFTSAQHSQSASLQNRVEKLTRVMASHLGFGQHQAAAEAAARLALADLATATVTEMTALAGVMGRVYALHQGEPPEVAQAIYESVLPRCGPAFPRPTHCHTSPG